MSVEHGTIGKGNPMDQSTNANPATSEDAFLNLESKRPTRVSSKRETSRARPSDITVTEPTYLSYTPETASGSLRQAAMTPRRSSSPFAAAASPQFARASASPRHLSPATSQIFERDVKEPILAPELSPAIPSHIQTDDHIPPVLDASSEVITNKGMDVDEVEVVTHTMHQPAALTVVSAAHGEPLQTTHGAPESQFVNAVPTQELNDENNTSYGTVDPTDPRRLSFISWADVVHGEQVETGKEASTHLMSPSSAGFSQLGARSPSPVRSWRSDRAPLSPPMAGGRETSPSSKGPGSISSGQGISQHSEITVQTMRETLQKTGSNDAVPEFRTE